MRRSLLVAAAMATVGFNGSYLMGSNTYVEVASGGFGTATLPAGAQEFFQDTFGTMPFYWDQHGRTIANAAVTTNTVDPGNLTAITMRLWTASDADLFKINIVNPAAFSASITSTTNVLSLFAVDGTAIAASRNGGPITGASLAPGFYFIGESQASGAFGGATFGVPRNNANEPLFDFTTDGLKSPVALADQKLSTDPFIAFTTKNASNPARLIGPSTFTSPGSTITLAGADFAVIPEPTTFGLVSAAGLLALRRRVRAR
jgi:hypothetical protein